MPEDGADANLPQDALILPALPDATRTADFWSLLSAVDPNGVKSDAAKTVTMIAALPPEPSLDDLFARVISAG